MSNLQNISIPSLKNIRKKIPDCISKTWKNSEKLGKTWKKSEFFRKCAEKIGPG